MTVNPSEQEVFVSPTFTVLLTTMSSRRSMASQSAEVSERRGASGEGRRASVGWSWSSFSSARVAFMACRLTWDQRRLLFVSFTIKCF